MYQLSPHHHPARSGEDEDVKEDIYSMYCEEVEKEDEEIVFIVEGNSMKRQQHHRTKKSTPACHHQASQTSITTFVPASDITYNSDSDGYSKRSAALLLILSMALLLGVLAVVVMVFNDSTNSSGSSSSSSSSNNNNYVPLLSQGTDPLQIPASSAATPARPVQKTPVSYKTESILPFFSAEEGEAEEVPSASSSKAAMTTEATATTDNTFTGIVAATAAVGDATATVVAAPPAHIAATAPALSSDPTVNNTRNISSTISHSDPFHRRGLRGTFRHLQDRPSTWMDALSRLAAALEEAVDRFEHGRRKEGREEGERIKPTTVKESDVNEVENVKKDVDGAVTS